MELSVPTTGTVAPVYRSAEWNTKANNRSAEWNPIRIWRGTGRLGRVRSGSVRSIALTLRLKLSKKAFIHFGGGLNDLMNKNLDIIIQVVNKLSEHFTSASKHMAEAC